MNSILERNEDRIKVQKEKLICLAWVHISKIPVQLNALVHTLIVCTIIMMEGNLRNEEVKG